MASTPVNTCQLPINGTGRLDVTLVDVILGASRCGVGLLCRRTPLLSGSVVLLLVGDFLEEIHFSKLWNR